VVPVSKKYIGTVFQNRGARSARRETPAGTHEVHVHLSCVYTLDYKCVAPVTVRKTLSMVCPLASSFLLLHGATVVVQHRDDVRTSMAFASKLAEASNPRLGPATRARS
jgi:hypothetical protein